MKNIIFLVPYPPGLVASQRFRFEHYIKTLEETGYSITLDSFYKKNDLNILYHPKKNLSKILLLTLRFFQRAKIVFTIHKYNIIFIHREITPIGPPLYEFVLSKLYRKKIIYDFDDAIWLDDPTEKNKLRSFLKWKSKINYIIKISNTVSCGNSYLKNYALQFNPNSILIPTLINPGYHKKPIVTPTESLRVGWTGTQSTMHYLKSIEKALSKVKEKYTFEIVVISNYQPDLDLDFTFIRWNKNSEIEDLSSFDIGLMPLTNDPWSHGKCGFKILQYMALEIPCLASPVGVNEEIITEGKNGFLCSNNEDWINKLSLLLENQSLRQKIGKAGRNKVMSDYSTQRYKDEFISLF